MGAENNANDTAVDMASVHNEPAKVVSDEKGSESQSVVVESVESDDGQGETTPNDSEPIQPADSDFERIGSTLSELVSKVSQLASLFEKKILHTEHEEKIVDQMHKELQRYKEDIYSQLVRPILLDIAEIRDSIMRVSAAHKGKADGGQTIPLATFEMYADDVKEILEKNNIEIYNSEVGSAFVPVRQRAIKKVPTADESMHGKVAESQSDGYNYMGRPISAEKVSVYFYDAQLSQNQSVEGQSTNREEISNG